MTNFNAVEILNAIANTCNAVLASRPGCKTQFARDLHTRLLEQLDAMMVDLGKEIEFAREFASTARTPEDIAAMEIYNICTGFEHDWIKGGPVSLLDPIHEIVAAECEGETCRIGVPFTEVTAPELEGLSEIMAMIARETGVRFVAARV